MRRKGLVILGLAAVMSMASVFSSFAGQWWQDSAGWWYQNDDGSYTKDDWQKIDEKWYHFDESGYMQTGWWIFPAEISYTYDGQTETRIEDHYYCLTDSGELLTDKVWDGGYLDSSGRLHFDELDVQDGKIFYYSRDGKYESFVGWKSQMLINWYNTLSDYKEYGSFSMDYQLPENWRDDCPVPLLTGDINDVCFYKWGGADIVNWDDGWRVDENNVIHMWADYWEYTE